MKKTIALRNNKTGQKARSDAYQWKIYEIPWSAESLHIIRESTPIEEEQSPEFLEYNEKILHYIADAIINKAGLSDQQRKVILMYADGFTQTEISKELGVNQSSINKVLNGNTASFDAHSGKVYDYKRTYGGIHRKISKYLVKDEVLRQMCVELMELS